MTSKIKKVLKKNKQSDIPVVQPLSPEVEPEDHRILLKKNMRMNVSKNDGVKSKLSIIIDLLSLDDTDDEKTVRKNVAIAVKHLREVEQIL